ncbi:alpha-1,4-glucan--maltose-1-phosphate maltosyltransferase [Homoserinimonas hongtaonis]|uniref:Alpha-1,4-glucan:maltose-1-phosphate maltosyltransferase n=1 Tax=Homoserinimonas hongtaonis TaxID=2079791 RepID=A0A2U1SZH4_9MICO|nr:alpha-1,4-glucan--maltose-1-phosphate maltosyltransferase [Salinibacterium hongtaonis]
MPTRAVPRFSHNVPRTACRAGSPSPSRAETDTVKNVASANAQLQHPTPAYTPRIGRIAITQLAPRQPENIWPAKAFVGEVVPFSATIFMEGHEVLGAELLLTDPAGAVTRHRMLERTKGTDRFVVDVLIDQQGTWSWSVRAFCDDWATWRHNASIKVAMNSDAELMVDEGAALLARAAREHPRSSVIRAQAVALGDTKLTPAARLAAALDSLLNAALANATIASRETFSGSLELRVERTRAGVGSWYEFFPRSEGAQRLKDGRWKSGTFRSAARRLPQLAAMGFDVLYLPPIHPIGTSFRKGPNNTLDAGPGDPGSPWAIGSAAGGHDAVHPDLGTIADFSAFVSAASRNGIEIALDLALQCSPDHPWVTDHPEWFTTRVDGTIAYAENPPKKYQDIYPLNFDNDPTGLREEVLRVVEHWIGLGVRIFRVDNPHTKPLQFWEWLLHEVAIRYPDVVFLAEAFTRPPMLQALAQVGFQQSYTYFTWRNTKQELIDYLTELSHETADYLRPNLFVNTPDILTEYLQRGGRAAHKIRAAIAATGAPTWGVYSAFELVENVARPGSEENIDNEKYEYRPRDYAAAEAEGTSLAPYLTTLNRIRSEHAALRQLRTFCAHWSDDDSVLVYTKYLPSEFTPDGRPDGIIVVANLDPHAIKETMVRLDLTRLGLEIDATFEVTDLVTGARFPWGRDTFVRLDPLVEPVHILQAHYTGGQSASRTTGVTA